MNEKSAFERLADHFPFFSPVQCPPEEVGEVSPYDEIADFLTLYVQM